MDEIKETKRIETQAAQEDREVEHNDQDAGQDEEKSGQLDRREAIAAAVAEHSASKESRTDVPEAGDSPTKAEVKTAIDNGEPPAEFSGEAKDAWRKGDHRRVIQEYDKLSRSRLQELSRAQTSEREALKKSKVWSDLGDKMSPYIAARGRQGVTPEVAIQEALALIDAFRAEDPATSKAELRKIGIDLDAAPRARTTSDPEKQALLERINRLESIHSENEFQASVQDFGQAFTALSSQRNRTGDPVFPGFFDESDSGKQLAREIGSLTQEQLFRQLVLRRYPNATTVDFVREAYVQLGGRVSGENARVSASNQLQTEKSKRAAASTPGRPTTSRTSNGQIGKLSRKEAIRAAIAEHSGEH